MEIPEKIMQEVITTCEKYKCAAYVWCSISSHPIGQDRLGNPVYRPVPGTSIRYTNPNAGGIAIYLPGFPVGRTDIYPTN